MRLRKVEIELVAKKDTLRKEYRDYRDEAGFIQT